MKILVTGALGQLGTAITHQLGDRAIPMDSRILDVTHEQQTVEVVHELQPDAIINCAAYTQVDRAEREPDRCTQVNMQGVANLVRAARQCGAVLVQISSDYVFGADSARRVPYVENDIPDPQSVYARSKLQGEKIAATWPRHFIVRTCGLYGASAHNNFVEKILQLARQRDCLQVVADQQCTPTYVGHLARAVQFLLAQTSYGTYHIVNSGQTNWYEFAQQILQLANSNVRVEPVTTAQFAAPASRPCFSVLDTTKYHSLGGPSMPHWSEALREYMTVRKT